MKIVDIANEIYLENASPTDTSIAAIAYWLRSSVGKFNNMTYEAYYVDPINLEILDASGAEITELPAAILKMMYKVYRVDLDTRNLVMATQADSVLKAQDQDFRIEKVNKSELLKTYALMKQDSLKELQDLVHNYRSYHGAPSQVTGDDAQEGHFAGLPNPFTRNSLGSGGN